MRDGTAGTLEDALTHADLAATLEPLERATMLPPAAFLRREVLDWELAHIFSAGWICAGHAGAVPESGDYLTRRLRDASFIVIRGEDGALRAFHNVCRHRGARLLEEPEGRVRRRLRCPYHAWSYDLTGELRAAPHMEEVEDFDTACYGLREIRTEVIEGLIMVDLSGQAPSLPDHVGDLGAHLRHYSVGALARAALVDYDVAANWKGIAENYNECLHCPGVHPELNALSDYMSGEELTGAGAWCGGSMTLNPGAETMGKDGGHLDRPPIATLAPSDLRNILYFALFPNALISLHPDYAMLHTLWPREPGRTEIVCEFFFEPSTIARPDFDPGDAVRFWDQTNRQDWRVCELTQRGVSSPGYTAGRYSGQEVDVHAFDSMIAACYADGLRETVIA